MDILAIAAIVVSLISLGFSAFVFLSLTGRLGRLPSTGKMERPPLSSSEGGSMHEEPKPAGSGAKEQLPVEHTDNPKELDNIEKFLYGLSMEIQRFSNSVSKNLDNISTRIGIKSTVRPIQFNMDTGTPKVVDSMTQDDQTKKP
ncbi:MAG TPA: hypothetical protein VKU79_04945 [Thermoplasmataceae archaeon]|nr:hypothetical protein [Thermoplasmataceae archaeon]